MNYQEETQIVTKSQAGYGPCDTSTSLRLSKEHRSKLIRLAISEGMKLSMGRLKSSSMGEMIRLLIERAREPEDKH